MIQQSSYTGDDPIDEKDALVIPFNLPMSRAKEGDFSGAGEAVLPHEAVADDDEAEHEIYISFDALLGKFVRIHGHFKSTSDD